jgi:hypothetical protein
MSAILKLSPKKNPFVISVGKNTGRKEFTKEDLTLHTQAHNPYFQPEFYDALEEMGLTYKETVLWDKDLIPDAWEMKKKGCQKYRFGLNSRYNDIKDSIDNGYDLRQKPLQVVVDSKAIPYSIFNGNTTNDILTKYTNLTNRLVAVYEFNDKYVRGNLSLIGLRLNVIQNPAGEASWQDIMKVIDELLDDGSLELPKNPTKKDVNDFVLLLGDKISYASAGKFKPDTAMVRKYINGVVESQTGKKSVISVNTGADVLELARLKGYIDTPNHVYHACSSTVEKQETTEKNLLVRLFNAQPDTGIDMTDVGVSTIVHMGAPDPKNPIKDFFMTYYKFYYEYLEMKAYDQQKYRNPVDSGKFKLLGFFQQVKELEDLWEFGSIVPPEKFMAEFTKRYPQKKTEVPFLNKDL